MYHFTIMSFRSYVSIMVFELGKCQAFSLSGIIENEAELHRD